MPFVTLIFTKNRDVEPPAILQCDTSGEYFPFYFFDWRDAIHYYQWCQHNNKEYSQHDTFQEWCELYGYDENEEFNGDLNEFKCNKNDENKCIMDTTNGIVSGSTDLNKKSAWN